MSVHPQLMPPGWLLTTLADLFIEPKSDIVDGPFGSNLKATEYRTTGVPILRIQNIQHNAFINKNIKFVTKEKAELLTRHSYKPGDIVLTKLGNPLGKACLVPELFDDGIIVADIVRLRLNHGFIDKQFLVYSINAQQIAQQLKSLTKGTTRPRVNLSHVRNLALILPPLPEQHRIVTKIEELFSELDKGVENLKTAREQLKVYRQAVLKHAFEGKLTSNYLANGIPFGWKKMSLKEISLEKGGLRRGPFGSAIKKEIFVPKGYKVYEQGNAINDDPYRGHYYISPEKYQELISFQVVPGDLLVSCSGVTLGRIVQIPDNAEPGIINQALLRIRLKADLIGSKFFINLFRSEAFQKLIFTKSQGTAMPNLIGIKDFKEVQVLVPPISEQYQIVQQIESRFSVVAKLEQTIDESLQKAEALRQSIMKKAFEGKLVRQDPHDEPAGVLLERIKAEKTKQAQYRKITARRKNISK